MSVTKVLFSDMHVTGKFYYRQYSGIQILDPGWPSLIVRSGIISRKHDLKIHHILNLLDFVFLVGVPAFLLVSSMYLGYCKTCTTFSCISLLCYDDYI